MSSPVSAVWAFKKALVAATRELMAADEDTIRVLVTAGTPGTYAPDDIIAFGRASSRQDRANLGPQRQREEVLSCSATFSCLVGGGEEAEEESQERALQLLGLIERHVRLTDTTLGGVVRHCFLTEIETEGETPPEYTSQGRAVDVVATFEARNRVKG
ncbi:hypothetical protein [Arthrobacter sp. B1805]|uniref:hypothetical protein n=1 Tax=Arthrobacter sp. B1805 TaxID=2058892 RepID=UPI000CE32D86|nr:hypothetical protein [Arthrobacter sp. B1805]